MSGGGGQESTGAARGLITSAHSLDLAALAHACLLCSKGVTGGREGAFKLEVKKLRNQENVQCLEAKGDNLNLLRSKSPQTPSKASPALIDN
ncbi:hypothetical protein PoB_003715300 [Plakobranchus ocellatus]|uniref:Uncharacterized protein n=1 Tax=Plakobranchus ocellatus TaxID=259542 RepID=A0AAV4AVV5_9GAST|nr:hypothetical protein PoB_003715300 [Plakobranchus ocellatus]